MGVLSLHAFFVDLAHPKDFTSQWNSLMKDGPDDCWKTAKYARQHISFGRAIRKTPLLVYLPFQFWEQRQEAIEALVQLAEFDGVKSRIPLGNVNVQEDHVAADDDENGMPASAQANANQIFAGRDKGKDNEIPDVV